MLLKSAEVRRDVPLSPHRVMGLSCALASAVQVQILPPKLRLNTERVVGPMPALSTDMSMSDVQRCTASYSMLVDKWKDKAQRIHTRE